MSNPDLESLISTDLIELDLQFENKMDAIEKLLDIVLENDKVNDRGKALEDLKKREKEATTGVGKGIGIPHAKTSAVKEPTVAFIRAEEGVDFGASDGKPAKLLFMLLFPENSEEDYLDLLSTISRSLIHDEVRQDLLEAGDEERVMEILEKEVSK